MLGLLLILSGALGAFAVFLQGSKPDRITKNNCDRIREGMCRTQVEDILGGPSGDYRSVPTVLQDDEPIRGQRYMYREIKPKLERWQGDSGDIFVVFVNDAVSQAVFAPSSQLEQTSLEYLRWKINRWW
jgi:hypothetical protein